MRSWVRSQPPQFQETTSQSALARLPAVVLPPALAVPSSGLQEGVTGDPFASAEQPMASLLLVTLNGLLGVMGEVASTAEAAAELAVVATPASLPSSRGDRISSFSPSMASRCT